MTVAIFDPRQCSLGEGPLWHPERQQLYWFDILAKQMLSRREGSALTWQFDEHVSAAGRIDRDTLLIASETQLFTFNLETEEQVHILPLEATNKITRSNDGRADRWGGFWIGTMGKNAEPNAGAIYRLYQGDVRKLASDITVSNAICFCPKSPTAYYTDTETHQVLRIPLHPDTGWPEGDPTIFLDLTQDRLYPDGAVTDVDGNLWLAEWGAARVACYDTTGQRTRIVPVSGRQSSCPAFGGPELRDLFITTARVGLGSKTTDGDGQTFHATDIAQGVAEPRVIL